MFDLVYFFFLSFRVYVFDSRQLDIFNEIILAVLVFHFIRVLILTLAAGCVSIVLNALNFFGFIDGF